MVLVSGPTIAEDEKLIVALSKHAGVIRNRNNSKIEKRLSTNKICLVLLEITKESAFEIEMIARIKRYYPYIEILVVNGDGDRDVLAEAFKWGTKDAFRRPYNTDLIVDRVLAILNVKT